jgi:hypothetical protein
MMVMRLAADCYIELPAGASCRSEGDDFLCCDDSGKVVARTERMKVMAYGNAQTLRLRTNDISGPSDVDGLRSRYDKARRRFLELEAELNQMLDEVGQARTHRNLARLESLGMELSKVHDSDYAPYVSHLLKTLLSEPVAT